MKLVALTIAAGLVATVAAAQTTTAQTTTPAQPGTPAVTAVPGAVTGAGKAVGNTVGNATDATTGAVTSAGKSVGNAVGATTDNGPAAAGGDNNQAVATTSANARQPAKGANSFTAGEAQGRIESEGYTTVSNLKKDNDGIWRGTASKNGASVSVWLDYKGNIGQQ